MAYVSYGSMNLDVSFKLCPLAHLEPHIRILPEWNQSCQPLGQILKNFRIRLLMASMLSNLRVPEKS